MENYEIYQDIAKRTQGDIYIGVVGPVRTGKSTFIKKFMELLVLPNIEDSYKKERAIDELPQSASGKTIMTTEPKFIPNEAVEISLEQNIKMKARLVDCVGYLVSPALGYLEENMPRMVKTPWSEEEMPFETAAELGTKKVITEHSTVGIVVTTDGSITDIPRGEYLEAENRVIEELKEYNKPFIILLNCQNPKDVYSIELAQDLSNKYHTTVIPVNCLELSIDDINSIFSQLLYEFSIERVQINYPKWINGLNRDSELKQTLFEVVKNSFDNVSKIKDLQNSYKKMEQCEYIKKVNLEEVNLGNGIVSIEADLEESLFYEMLTSITGMQIKNEGELFSCMNEFYKI